MIYRIIIGLIAVVVGFLMIWKTEAFYNFAGSIDWAERHMAGGTRSFLKLLGVIVILVGFIVTFNMYVGILDFVFQPRRA